VIYTATDPTYADRIINRIEFPTKYFSFRLYKQQCLRLPNGMLCKPLELLCTNRDINNIIIVDNWPISFVLNVSNGIPVRSFTGSQSDTELLELAKYLKELSNEESVIEKLKRDLIF